MTRGLLALLVAAAFVVEGTRPGLAFDDPPTDAPAEEDPKLPKIGEMMLPTVEELVKGPRLDWIVLENEDVLVVQPVYPRPKTLERIEQRLDELRQQTPRNPEERARLAEQREELRFLTVLLPGDDVTEYRLQVSKIAQVVHHEDLLLGRVRRLIEEGDLRGGYELLFPLVRRSPDWPAVAEVEALLLSTQAAKRLDEGRPEEALVYLEELQDRTPGDGEVVNRIVSTFETLIEAAARAEDHRRVRHFVARLRRRLPGHSAVEEWTSRLVARAGEQIDLARDAEQAGDHRRAAELADRAARIWPSAEGARELHQRTGNRWQTLRVGVREFGESQPPLPIETAARHRRLALLTTRLFELDGVETRTLYRHPDLREWEPQDLGREVVLRLRRGRERWQPQSPIEASRYVAALERRLDPSSTAYDERFDAFVASVVATSPSEATLRFERTPLRPEPLLAVAAADEDGMPHGRFRPILPDEEGDAKQSGTRDVRLYQRTVPEPDGLAAEAYHVAEIQEHRYDRWDDALQGLLRGEVDLVPSVGPWEVDALVADERFVVRPLALPATHVLQFNWEVPALRNATFRRAIGYATDTRRVLREVVLRSENSPHGRLVSAPWPRDSPYYEQVPPREANLALAVTLRLTAERELKKLPELRVLVVGDDLAFAAAEEILDDWRRAGIAARLVTDAEFAAESEPHWDVLYRSVSMAEPVYDLWPFLLVRPTARLEDLRVLPDWLRAELLALERVTDWREAESRMRGLHEKLHSDVRYVPLWEIDQHFVHRTNLRPRTSPDLPVAGVYDDVERWIIRPAYPTEVP